MKSNLHEHQSIGGKEDKTEDEWIIEFVNNDPETFKRYLMWRDIVEATTVAQANEFLLEDEEDAIGD